MNLEKNKFLVPPKECKENDAEDQTANAQWTTKNERWVPCPVKAFRMATLKFEGEDTSFLLLSDGQEIEVDNEEVQEMNPPSRLMMRDMARLTVLNEPAVLHNMVMRYKSNAIHVSRGFLFMLEVERER